MKPICVVCIAQCCSDPSQSLVYNTKYPYREQQCTALLIPYPELVQYTETLSLSLPRTYVYPSVLIFTPIIPRLHSGTPSSHPYHTLIIPSSHPYHTLIIPILYPHHTLITPYHTHITLCPYHTRITLSLHPYHTLSMTKLTTTAFTIVKVPARGQI